MAGVEIDYKAEPTPAKFHADPHRIRGIMGPYGSGKSVACVMEIFRLCCEQKPDKWQRRRSKWGVIRNTYGELKLTTIRTFQDWIPDEITDWRWDQPITCKITCPLPDGTSVRAEIIFMALDRPQHVRKLKSLELTSIWYNEAREIPYEIIRDGNARTGRYPSAKAGGATRACVLMDTNPPDDDHWWYTKFEEQKPEGWAIFKQPGALIRTKSGGYLPNPYAENVQHQALGYNYWMRMVEGEDEQWINVYVLGEYGSVQEGRPVYPEWRDSIHCASEDLEVWSGRPLYLGFDYGLTPACVFVQSSPMGQLRILDELCVDANGLGMGVRQFTREVVIPHIREHYERVPEIIAYGDPAGKGRQQGEGTEIQSVLAEEGLPVQAAPSNDFTVRREAVAYYLNAMIDGEPGLLLSPRCKILRKGFNGKYKFERLQVATAPGEIRLRDQPAKNSASHPHDALQYAALGIRAPARPRGRRREVVTKSAVGWT